MKNIIKYFYNIDLDDIRMIDDNYFFIYKGKKFVFYRVNDNNFKYDLIYKLNSFLVRGKNNYYEIIPNKNKSIVTANEDSNYVLMMENFSYDRELNYLDIMNSNVIVDDNFYDINVNDWNRLWKIKIDYFEMFIENNINKYKELNKYFNYFIGLAENAIIYYEETIETEKTNALDKLVISHKRIASEYTLKDLYNPVSFVIDHPSRDLSEYLKMLFWKDKKNYNIMDGCLNHVNLSNFGARILFARMLYPSFFLDSFEDMLNNKINQKRIFEIINRMEDYEKYLFQIYKELKKKFDIPDVKWIKKADYSSTFTTPKTSGISLTSIDSIPSFSVMSIMLQ